MERYRAEHPGEPVLYLDAGRAFPLKTQESDVVVPSMVEAFRTLGLDVMNAGYRDLDLGFGVFSALTRAAGFKCVSANLVDLDRGAPVLPPYVVITPRPGQRRAPGPRVAVVGLTDPGRYRVIEGLGGQKLHFVDPLAVADTVLSRAGSESDLLIVLANFGQGLARGLAGKHPEIDLIIGNDEGLPQPMEMEFNGVPIWTTGVEGRKLIRLDLFRTSGPRRWRIVPTVTDLSPSVIPDSAAVRFVSNLRITLDEHNRRRQETVRKDPHAPSYVGSEACASCHAAPAGIWRASAHARAWAPLQRLDAVQNPLCLQCHAVGYLKPNGFTTTESRPGLTGVGCESCHGPGGRHVQDPRAAPLGPVAAEVCADCHTPGQSPGFQFATAWPRIQH